jgi:hypothetical protein
MQLDKDSDRQRMFELFDEAARVADRIGERAIATIALGAAMVAARPCALRRKRAVRGPSMRRASSRARDEGA